MDDDAIHVARAESLANALKSLASPLRLAILWSLRFPKRVGDIRLPAAAEWSGFQAERTLARSTIIHHVELLESMGFVERIDGEGRLVVHQQRMFAFLEELGALARLKPVVDLDVDETHALDAREPPSLPLGPRLLLVAGPKEGHALDLSGAGPWLVGRGAEAHLRIDYDPHVSRGHVELSRRAGGFAARVVRGAKNPAQLNYRPLRENEEKPMKAGDVLTVGSSRLVLQA